MLVKLIIFQTTKISNENIIKVMINIMGQAL